MAEWRPCISPATSSTAATSPSKSCIRAWRRRWVRDRFLREIEIVAQLQHPAHRAALRFGRGGRRALLCDAVRDGASLRQRLARDGALPVDDVVPILRDVCDALAYAHGRGIVHRDIKPDNVLLSGGHAMVTDFGVAKAASDAAATGTHHGGRCRARHAGLHGARADRRATRASIIAPTSTRSAFSPTSCWRDDRRSSARRAAEHSLPRI